MSDTKKEQDTQVLTEEQLVEIDRFLSAYIPNEYVLIIPMIEGSRLIARMPRDLVANFLNLTADTLQQDSFSTLTTLKDN